MSNMANAALSAEIARDLLVLMDGAHADTDTKLAALAIAQSVIERRGLLCRHGLPKGEGYECGVCRFLSPGVAA
jgi:hypothetical protein